MKSDWNDTRHDVNGLALHWVEAGPPKGPLLILLHGFPEFWWGWHHHITPLAEQGFHVIALDMRGYNLSDAPQEIDAYRLDALVADVVALADHHGAESFQLVGHDWGGVVAWSVAARHPQRLTRLVVMAAPHPGQWTREVFKHPTQLVRSSYVALFQLPWLPEALLQGFGFASLRTTLIGSANPSTFSSDDLARYAEAWSQPGALTGMLNYYRALRERTSFDHAARIEPRTLILWGEKDRFLEAHLARAALELCDDARLEIVPGTTHWLHHEAPERIGTLLAGFLKADKMSRA
ncbi:alpha/beta fold hydrolase [Billgrantia saliphila]|uniref:alpha/beta fold hydrolase n=1 Tax=Billgrantia saliphila TaxID=1848458 RepID=UPI000CE4CFD7|nr:alpha/beta hydrolase [Halomonas saliphila]